MLNINEAIDNFEYDAECNRADLDFDYAENNEQIAKWLKELKTYRECNVCEYNKVIDDFKEKLLYQIEDLDVRDIIMKTSAELKMDIEE